MDRIANSLSFVRHVSSIAYHYRCKLEEELRQETAKLQSTRDEHAAVRERAKAHGVIMKVASNYSSGKLFTEITRLEGCVKVLRTKIDAIPNERDFRDQYEEILEIPRVLSIRANDNRLVVKTDTLYGKDRDYKWHRVGRYTISYDAHLSGAQSQKATFERFCWFREGGPILAGNAAVMTSFGAGLDGQRVCLGTALPPLEASLSAMDHVSLVKLLVRFPEVPGLNDLMRFWPHVNVKDVPKWYIDTFGR